MFRSRPDDRQVSQCVGWYAELFFKFLFRMPVNHLLQADPGFRIYLRVVDGDGDFHRVIIDPVITLFNVRVHAARMSLLIRPTIFVETGRLDDEGVIIGHLDATTNKVVMASARIGWRGRVRRAIT